MGTSRWSGFSRSGAPRDSSPAAPATVLDKAQSQPDTNVHHRPEGVMTAPQLAMKDLRRVVIAAAVGNVIEWYDFYIFGSLAILLASKFFGQSASGSDLIKYVGTFTAGVLFRPVGAVFFRRFGALVGRPRTFFITLNCTGGLW